MDPNTEAEKTRRLSDLSDTQLLKRFCAEPPDREAGEELFGRCKPKILKFVRSWAAKMMYHLPRMIDREAFVQDAAGRAREKLVRKIRTFGFRGSFDGWLRRLSVRAAKEEFLTIIGRGPEPRVFVPLEAAFHSKHWASPFERVRDLERGDILETLLTEHGKASNRNWKSSAAISKSTWEGYTAGEIAKDLDTTLDYAYQLISHDYEALRVLFAQEFGVTSIDQI